MMVITAERVPHDTGTSLSGVPGSVACVSTIVFAGEVPGHVKPDPVHLVIAEAPELLKAHV